MTYDYYYSEQHEAFMKRTYKGMGEKYLDTFVDGKKYTEMIEKGKTPLTSHFKDIKKIHTGSDKDITTTHKK